MKYRNFSLALHRNHIDYPDAERPRRSLRVLLGGCWKEAQAASRSAFSSDSLMSDSERGSYRQRISGAFQCNVVRNTCLSWLFLHRETICTRSEQQPFLLAEKRLASDQTRYLGLGLRKAQGNWPNPS